MAAAGIVHIPWYATGFRADELAAGLEHICGVALRYGARGYAVYRARDDRYKFLQVLEWDEKIDWERFWEGPALIDFRIDYSGAYQVPVVYVWQDVVCRGTGPGTGHTGEPVAQAALADAPSG
jgi:hypothetical protein